MKEQIGQMKGMDKTQHEINREQLEKLLDGCALDTLIYTLSEICYDKSIHLEANWMDIKTAKKWKRAAKYLDGVSQTHAVQEVSI